MNTAELRDLLTRESVAQAVCDALNSGDDSYAGYLLRMGGKFLPVYRQADKLNDTLARVVAAGEVA